MGVPPAGALPRLGSAVPHFAHAHRPHSVARKLAPSFRSAPSAVFHSLTLRARRRAFFIYRNLNIFWVFFRQNKGKCAFVGKNRSGREYGNAKVPSKKSLWLVLSECLRPFYLDFTQMKKITMKSFRQKLAFAGICRKSRRRCKEKARNVSDKKRIIQVFVGKSAENKLFCTINTI